MMIGSGWRSFMRQPLGGRRSCWMRIWATMYLQRPRKPMRKARKNPARLTAAFSRGTPMGRAQPPSTVFGVADLTAAVRSATGAGGKVLGEPLEIPGVGQYVSFTDTEGNRVSMLQPIPRHWHAPQS